MIKHQHLTFINTTKSTKTISITYELGGRVDTTVITLNAGEVFSEASAKIIIGHKANLIDIKTADASGAVKSVLPQRLSTPQDILKASAVLDIETTNLRPGAPITQVAVHSLSNKESNFFIPRSQSFVATVNSLEEGISFQQRLQAKRIQVPKGTSFRDLKYVETYMEMKGFKLDTLTDGSLKMHMASAKRQVSQIEDYLIKKDKFQAKLFVPAEKLARAGIKPDPNKQILMQAIIDGTLTEEEVLNYLRKNQGVLNLTQELNSLTVRTDRSLRDIINSDVPELLKGKVTWIANANFESSQFGARIRAEAFDSMAAINAAREAAGAYRSTPSH